MRFAIFGVGAVGGYFGGKLAAGGEDVLFIARGATLAALRADGLRVRSIGGDFTVHPVRASDGGDAPAAVECVLVCVKAWQVPGAAERIAGLLAPDGFAVYLGNGVEAPEQLAAALGRERVLGGLCRIVAKQEAPAVIDHFGVSPTVVFGELDDRPSERVERLLAAFEDAGIDAVVPPSTRAALWEKFLFIAATSAVGAVTAVPAGVVRSCPESRQLLIAAMREIQDLARRQEIPVREDALERALAFYGSLPADVTASMQRDLMEGRPSELEAQTGAVVRLAEALEMPVPVHRFLYAALLPRELAVRASG
ncbi:MAG: ketopantoate reductase family protein [Thermoanaerobaculia bacterium]